LDDRQAEACVADRVEEETIAGGEPSKLGGRNLSQAAERFGVHPDQIQRDLTAHTPENIGAESTAPPPEMVDDHEPPGDLARVSCVVGHEDAVLDHARRGAATV